MKTEAITRENLSRYISMLSNDKFFDIESGRLSGFGACDEKSGDGMGVLAAEILPDHIRIVKLFTAEKFRKKGVATKLINMVCDLPDELKMPFYIITDRADADFQFLKEKGFVETDSPYKYIYSKLSDMRDIAAPDNVKDGFKIVPINQVPEQVLSYYISNAEPDKFLRFPEIPIDFDRFSEGSLVCIKDKSICAMLLIEEPEEAIEISFMHCIDPKALYSILALIKPALLLEYSEEMNVRILVCNKNEESVGKGLLNNCVEKEIKILKKG